MILTQTDIIGNVHDNHFDPTAKNVNLHDRHKTKLTTKFKHT